jgi:hypothetical protein
MDLVILLALGALAKGVGPSLPPSGLGMAVLAQARGAAQGIRPDTTPSGETDWLPAIDHWQPYIAEATRRFRIPEPWIRAVMRAESGSETSLDGRPITSVAGAMGLMQIMPETYTEVSLREGLGSNPYDPRDNILAGAAYLREMYDRFGYPGLFAAYNAGPDRFEAYLREGAPLPDETWQYLAAISQAVAEAIALEEGRLDTTSVALTVHARNPRPAGLFFALSPSPADLGNVAGWRSSNPEPNIDSARIGTRSGALFVPLGMPVDAAPRLDERQ